ncbi:MAG: DUF3024 domain-containing protein [Desulfobacterales bacterium]|nr:DUF3024 domain-containing protein [Desulfobacterales bacterium]
MSFNDIELKRIKKIVGGFCIDRIPDHQRSQVKLLYEMRGFEVKLSEARPFRGVMSGPNGRWPGSNTIRTPSAGSCISAPSDRWRKYPAAEPTNNLKALVELLRDDPFHLFWG